MSRAFKTFIKQDDETYKYTYHEPVNVIYGDTDSTYINLEKMFDKNSNPDDVISFADNLGETVNSQFPRFMMDVFNVPEDRTPIIQTEREVVSDRSYFMKKKKYAMHLVNKEGVPVDETKVMGMEIKKSSTNKAIRDFLSKLIDMIMHGTPYHEISQAVGDFKQEYSQLPMMDIGSPTTLNSLTKHEEAIQEGDKEAMKKIPYHARASIVYNGLCGPSDIKIRPGDKIKVVYIIHPDTPYIAIPIDAQELPEFLDDLIIDRKTHWDKAKKLIDLYLESASLDRATRRKEMLNSIGVTLT